MSARETVYRGYLDVQRWRLRHDLFGGGESDEIARELVERGRAVVVMPYDPALDAVVMVEQFRIGAHALPAGAWLLEFVAGMVEPGESVAEVAVRESREEAGLALGEQLPVADYLPSPGVCSERVSIVCARCDASRAGGVHGLDSEHEDIRVQVLPVTRALAMVDDGRLHSAAPIIALEWLRRRRDELRRRWR